MYVAFQELRSRLTSRSRISIWIGASIACAISDPFGLGLIFGEIGKGFFWFFAIAMAIVFGNISELFVRRTFPGVSIVLALVLQAIGFTFFYSLLVVSILLGFSPNWAEMGIAFSEIAVNCGMIYLVVTVIKELFIHSTTPAPAIFNRLPDALGTELLWVSSRDHYVEVCTKLGKEQILMRFSDALNELEGCAGFQVHRSHWVARAAIVGVQRSSAKVELDLSDGTTIPVSRSYHEVVEKEGIL